MKFRVERDALVQALSVVAPAIATRGGALPVLAGVHLWADADRGLTLAATDLDLTVTTRIDAEVGAGGVAVIPGKILSDLVRSVEAGAINVDYGEATNTVDVSAGKFRSTLNCLPADEWPRVDNLSDRPGATVNYEELATAIAQVVVAASSDDARPILTGVLFEKRNAGADGDTLRVVATDSYRLAYRDLPGTDIGYEEGEVLVPSRALRVLGKAKPAETITVHLAERAASFHIGETAITTRLIEGEFPNYRGLLPDDNTYGMRVTVPREAMTDAVSRVSLMAREATPVRLDIDPGQLTGVTLEAVTQDIGQASETFDAQIVGDAQLTVGFNPDYLSDGLDHVPGDEVLIRLRDGNKPAVLTAPGDGSYLYLLMPVRI